MDPGAGAHPTADGAPGRLRGSAGNVSLFVVLLMPALILAAGLVLDGGRQIQARREAQGTAAAAARAAVQMSPEEAFGNGLDAGLAASRAQAELGRQGASGSVSVSGNAVTVRVSAPVDYLILPGGGTVNQSSTATPLDGVTGASP
jgi:Flp pilus assembly protein TadG